MSSARVTITDFITGDMSPERGVLGDRVELTALNAHGEEELAGRIEDVSVVLSYGTFPLTRHTIQRLEACKLIIRCGVGYDSIDHSFARSRGIPVANVPDYATEEVADSAIGLMLGLTRGILTLDSKLKMREGPWTFRLAAPLTRLRGCVFGVVGLGRIGTAAMVRAKSLGMKVMFCDPYKASGYDRVFGISRAETLDALLEKSFVVSLHCPLTPETAGMIDAGRLELMPHGSYLINTARGGLVDNRAIPAAIESGRLAGAGIDVLEHEPPPDDHPLVLAWRNPDHPAHHRVIINPHSAFYSKESLLELRTKSALAASLALAGRSVPNIVN